MRGDRCTERDAVIVNNAADEYAQGIRGGNSYAFAYLIKFLLGCLIYARGNLKRHADTSWLSPVAILSRFRSGCNDFKPHAKLSSWQHCTELKCLNIHCKARSQVSAARNSSCDQNIATHTELQSKHIIQLQAKLEALNETESQASSFWGFCKRLSSFTLDFALQYKM
jgi:hypothetical protein